MNNNFAGWLKTFEKKGEGDEVMDDGVLIEVTAVKKTGEVEIAYDDRNERVYLRLNLADLVRHVCLTGITEDE